MVNKYFSLEDFATWRGVTPSTTTSPTLTQVEQYITSSEEEFDITVGDYGTLTDQIEIIKALDFGFYIPKGHITTLTTVEVSNGDLITPTWSTVTSTDYVLNVQKTGRVRMRSPIIDREYRITFNSGYDYASVPNEIKEIVYLMTMKRIAQFNMFETGVASNVTRIIDVDVYREITKGGDPFKGMSAMDMVISDAKGLFKGKLRTIREW